MKNIAYEVPGKDKEIFLDPPINRIPDLLAANRKKMLDYGFKVAGIPFQVVREKTRKDILYMSQRYTAKIQSLFCNNQKEGYFSVRNGNQNEMRSGERGDKTHGKEITMDCKAIRDIAIIQTGHEPVLYYPGIWIKNHLIHYLSEKLNGIGVNMIVDNDACNAGFLFMPVLSHEQASVQKVMLVEGKAKMAYEEVVFNDLRKIMQFREEVLALFRKNATNQRVKTANEGMQTMFEWFTDAITRYYNRGCTDMAGLLTAVRCALEKEFCIHNLEVPVSRIGDIEGFSCFLLHIIYDASRFAEIYNNTLHEYRHVHNIRTKANPMPDLVITENLIEIPFWVWTTGGNRMKCFVVNEKESIKVTDGSETLITLSKNEAVPQHRARLKDLTKKGIKLRPRAITTSMFSRLLFSDIFVHGIGGAKYDVITDAIIREYFGVIPPGFITVSATLFLPLEACDLDITDLQRRQHEIQDIWYNPGRYASNEIQRNTEFMQKAEEKQALLKAMAGCSAGDKKQYFNRIRELNAQMHHLMRDEILRREEDVKKMEDKRLYNEVVRFREYPIYLYPMPVLQKYFQHVFS